MAPLVTLLWHHEMRPSPGGAQLLAVVREPRPGGHTQLKDVPWARVTHHVTRACLPRSATMISIRSANQRFPSALRRGEEGRTHVDTRQAMGNDARCEQNAATGGPRRASPAAGSHPSSPRPQRVLRPDSQRRRRPLQGKRAGSWSASSQPPGLSVPTRTGKIISEGQFREGPRISFPSSFLPLRVF